MQRPTLFRPVPGIIPATLTFARRREVPTLYLVAERDRFTPLAGQYELFERTRSSKQMFILRHADHQHFADAIDDPGLCAPEVAHLFTRVWASRTWDAVLKQKRDAREFLAHDPVARLRERGVDAVEYLGAAADSAAS